jgi:hypothetical protein
LARRWTFGRFAPIPAVRVAHDRMPQIRPLSDPPAQRRHVAGAAKNGSDADERLFELADVAPFPGGDLIG